MASREHTPQRHRTQALADSTQGWGDEYADQSFAAAGTSKALGYRAFDRAGLTQDCRVLDRAKSTGRILQDEIAHSGAKSGRAFMPRAGCEWSHLGEGLQAPRARSRKDARHLRLGASAPERRASLVGAATSAQAMKQRSPKPRALGRGHTFRMDNTTGEYSQDVSRHAPDDDGFDEYGEPIRPGAMSPERKKQLVDWLMQRSGRCEFDCKTALKAYGDPEEALDGLLYNVQNKTFRDLVTRREELDPDKEPWSKSFTGYRALHDKGANYYSRGEPSSRSRSATPTRRSATPPPSVQRRPSVGGMLHGSAHERECPVEDVALHRVPPGRRSCNEARMERELGMSLGSKKGRETEADAQKHRYRQESTYQAEMNMYAAGIRKARRPSTRVKNLTKQVQAELAALEDEEEEDEDEEEEDSDDYPPTPPPGRSPSPQRFHPSPSRSPHKEPRGHTGMDLSPPSSIRPWDDEDEKACAEALASVLECLAEDPRRPILEVLEHAVKLSLNLRDPRVESALDSLAQIPQFAT